MQEVGGGDLAQQMHSLDSALQQRLNSSKPAPEVAADEMTFERKRRLSIALGQLQGDRIADVMRIIADDETMREKVCACSPAPGPWPFKSPHVGSYDSIW